MHFLLHIYHFFLFDYKQVMLNIFRCDIKWNLSPLKFGSHILPLKRMWDESGLIICSLFSFHFHYMTSVQIHILSRRLANYQNIKWWKWHFQGDIIFVTKQDVSKPHLKKWDFVKLLFLFHSTCLQPSTPLKYEFVHLSDGKKVRN